MWIFFIMLLVIEPRGGLALVDEFELRLIGITLLSPRLRMIVDIGLRYTFWQLFVWQLSCVSGLFL